MERAAKAIWRGNLKEGHGILETDSQILKGTPYSFRSRFEEGVETNPEELIAAAHAGCFSMALSNELAHANLTAEKIETIAQVSLELVDNQWKITKIHLQLKAEVPGADQAKFLEIAEKAKTNCPVSKLMNAEITLDAELQE